jgi:hypothetical protein
MPLRLEAAILSRMDSPVTPRSNWAKESSTLSVGRPIEVVVLNCWVTAMNDTRAHRTSPHLGEVGQRAGQPVDLVDHHNLGRTLADICEQSLQGRSLHGPPEIPPSSKAVLISLQPSLDWLLMNASQASRWAAGS